MTLAQGRRVREERERDPLPTLRTKPARTTLAPNLTMERRLAAPASPRAGVPRAGTSGSLRGTQMVQCRLLEMRHRGGGGARTCIGGTVIIGRKKLWTKGAAGTSTCGKAALGDPTVGTNHAGRALHCRCNAAAAPPPPVLPPSPTITTATTSTAPPTTGQTGCTLAPPPPGKVVTTATFDKVGRCCQTVAQNGEAAETAHVDDLGQCEQKCRQNQASRGNRVQQKPVLCREANKEWLSANQPGRQAY